MEQRLIILSMLGNTLLWSFGFAGGLILGFTIPILGDVFAVFLAGSLVISLQSFLMRDIVQSRVWIKSTAIGLVVSTALSFVIALVSNRTFLQLNTSHIVAFPLLIIGILAYQSYSLTN